VTIRAIVYAPASNIDVSIYVHVYVYVHVHVYVQIYMSVRPVYTMHTRFKPGERFFGATVVRLIFNFNVGTFVVPFPDDINHFY
jgi:hypothetical protein